MERQCIYKLEIGVCQRDFMPVSRETCLYIWASMFACYVSNIVLDVAAVVHC